MGIFEDLTNRNNGDEVDASWWNSIIVALRNAFPDYTALTGDVVGTTDTQDISNKTFTDPITLTELGSTPGTPAAGDKKLYAKDDGKVYTLDDEGNEVEVGSGAGGGTKTYIDNESAKLETSIGSWATDDGAGSAAATITLTQNTTTPLSGDGDLSFAKSAADGDGEFAKVTTLAIDRSDRGGILFFSCNFDASDSNYAENLEFEFYDNTNSAVLYAGATEDLAVSKTTGKFTAPVYLESTTAEIEVRIKVNDTDATAYTVYFDDFKFGPAAQVQTVYRKSQTIDLTGSGDFTAGEIQVERVGNIVTISNTSALTFSSGSLMSSAAGVIPDWARPSATVANASTTNSGWVLQTFLETNGTLNVNFRDWAGSSSNQVTANQIGITYTVPDTTGPTLTENELSLQTVRVTGAGNGGTSLTANVTNIDFTEVSDTHSAWDGNSFTALKSGYYQAKGMIRLSASTDIGVFSYIDGTQEKLVEAVGVTGANHQFSWEGYLAKNEVLSFRSSVSATLSNSSSLHWIEISSLPDYTVLGAVKERNRVQTKILSADFTSGTTISDLTFSNLVVGKWYEFTGKIWLQVNNGAGDNTAIVNVTHDGNTIDRVLFQIDDGGTADDQNTIAVAGKFKATATSLTFVGNSITSNSFIRGNGTRNETYIQLEERNDLIETTDF